MNPLASITVVCKKCGRPIKSTQYRFGSQLTGWEHVGRECEDELKSGVELIADERQRQVSVEGWTPEHDAEHDGFELTNAARCYIAAFLWSTIPQLSQPMSANTRDEAAPWPWEEEAWKPSLDGIRNLVKAGALIAAEIDRIQSQA